MKTLLALAVVVLAAGPAMASKARITALQAAPHLEDTSTAIFSPDELTRMGNWATLEMGGTNTAGTADAQTSPEAEGGFARASGDAFYGFYLGKKNTWTSLRKTPSATVYLAEENPVDLYYASKMGDMAWGAGLYYSASDRKATGKQSSIALNLGASTTVWDVTLNLGIADTAEVGTNEYKGKMPITLAGGYMMDSLYINGDVTMKGYKETAAGATVQEQESTAFRVGVLQIEKFEGGEFFYGVSYKMENNKNKFADTKVDETTLPFIAGVEADAASWLALRASITQNVLLGSKKDTGVSNDANSTANNTTVAAGAGLKFGKATLDATLTAANNGNLNANTLMANTGITYMW